MLLTVEQIKQLHTLLQEYPEATHISFRDVANGSGIGPDTFAHFIKWNFRTEYTTLASVDITDGGTW
jgi:hypothetical protein